MKLTLAFFLVVTAAGMVVLWMLHPPGGDAGMLAMLASFVTMFIKMAADAVGYQYNSSAGSEKKSDLLAQAPPIPTTETKPSTQPEQVK